MAEDSQPQTVEEIDAELARIRAERQRRAQNLRTEMAASGPVTVERIDQELAAIRAQRERQRPPPRVSTGEDVRRSFGTGFVRGTGAIAGTPSEAFNMLRQGGEDAARFLGADERTARQAGAFLGGIVNPLAGIAENVAAATSGPRVTTPTMEDATRAINDVIPGEPWQPQTTAGRYAESAGEFAPGIFIPGGGAARVAPNATRLARIAPVTRTAGAVGGATAFQAAEDADLPLPVQIAAAVTGDIVGRRLGGGNVPRLTPAQRADAQAVRLIDREMRTQNTAPQELVDRANKLLAQAPTVETNAELMGAGGQRLARATAAMGQGAGRSIAEEALGARAEGRARPRVSSIRDRVAREATKATETEADADYWQALDDLRLRRSNEARVGYEEAYRAEMDPVAVSGELIPYMREAPRQALNEASNQLAIEQARVRARIVEARLQNQPDVIEQLTRDLSDITEARRQLDQLANGVTPNTINTRAVDYFQRGLRQLEVNAGRGSPAASSLSETRNAFNDMADRINPQLAAARRQYSLDVDTENVMAAGRRVFEMSDGEIDRVLRGRGFGLSTQEFDGFMIGVMDAIERKLNAGDTQFLSRLMRNRNWQEQLARALGGGEQGAKNARRFMARIAREVQMQRFRGFVESGSRTTPLQQDIEGLTVGADELAFLHDEAANFIASGGNIKGMFLRGITGLWNRFYRPGIADPAVQEALARRLFAPVTRQGAKDMRDALIALRNQRSTPTAMRDWIDSLLRFAPRYGPATVSREIEEQEAEPVAEPRRLGVQ